jgi:hypothetical protein
MMGIGSDSRNYYVTFSFDWNQGGVYNRLILDRR